MVSSRYETKKHSVTGEDADLEKSGSILNRVTKWGRDGITIEADQRRVREVSTDLDLERANHASDSMSCGKDEGRHSKK